MELGQKNIYEVCIIHDDLLFQLHLKRVLSKEKKGRKYNITLLTLLPDEEETLTWIEEIKFNVIFLPLSLHNYGALKLAEKIHLLDSQIALFLVSDTGAPAFVIEKLFDAFISKIYHVGFLEAELDRLLLSEKTNRLKSKEDIYAAIAAILATATCFDIGNGGRHIKGSSKLDNYKSGVKPNITNESISEIDELFKGPISIFISYSHDDEHYKNELIKHLSQLKRQGLINPWHDRDITGGDNWENAINMHLSEADIILLLVSSSFLASDYCYKNELKLAMIREKLGKAKVIPIIIRDVYWADSPFAYLQALPINAKPISLWHNQDKAWANVARQLLSIVKDTKKNKENKG